MCRQRAYHLFGLKSSIRWLCIHWIGVQLAGEQVRVVVLLLQPLEGCSFSFVHQLFIRIFFITDDQISIVQWVWKETE